MQFLYRSLVLLQFVVFNVCFSLASGAKEEPLMKDKPYEQPQPNVHPWQQHHQASCSYGLGIAHVMGMERMTTLPEHWKQNLSQNKSQLLPQREGRAQEVTKIKISISLTPFTPSRLLPALQAPCR